MEKLVYCKTSNELWAKGGCEMTNQELYEEQLAVDIECDIKMLGAEE